MYKTLIFDFDGTIANTLPFSWKKILFLLKKEKKITGPDKEIIEKIRSMTYLGVLKHFKISWLKFPLLVWEIKKAQKELYLVIDQVKLFPGVKDLILELKNRGFKLGILSSNLRKNIDRVLADNQLNQYFDFIDCGIGLFSKAGRLKKLINRLGLKKEEVIYVADEVRDIEACHKAKIKIISVTWGFNNKRLLTEYKPNWIVDRPEEIIETIEHN